MADVELPEFPQAPLTLGISECLVGGDVRHDGGHKSSSLPHEKLSGLFNFRGICPEVGIGLGVPRDAIRLVGEVEDPRCVSTKNSLVDVTARLKNYATQQIPSLNGADGYIFMKGSPSCGLFRVKVFGDDESPPRYEGRGVYAAEVVRRCPNLPVEEAGRLFDPVLRENFVARVFVHAHWRSLQLAGITPKSLIAFHSVYKYLVMAHSISAYRQLGRLLSDLSGEAEEIANRYFSQLMQALRTPATSGGHANVLSHLQGYVKNDLSPGSRRELADMIESYRRGEIPLLAPLSLLKHHLKNHDATYALGQFYLQPHPPKAGLRKEL